MRIAAFLKTLPGWVVLLLWTVVVALPLYALVVSCFKSTAEIYDSPLGLPPHWSFDNFVSAWVTLKLGQSLLNSLIVTVCAVLGTILVSAMAAYPLARYDIKWGPWMLLLFLAGIMLPIRLASVELFNLVKQLGLIDTLGGLILVYVAIRIPFAVFIFANFMRPLPRELEEAARIDGASELRILFQVILPVSLPAVAIVAIFTSIAVWNDFFFPLIFIFSDENKTVPLTIAGFIGQYRTDWGTIFASLGISLAPVLAMYLILARQIREGIGSAGAVK